MHGLNELVAMNDKAAQVRQEDNHNRACSIAEDGNGGVVLHSAKHRNTMFIKGAQALRFLRKWNMTENQAVRNHLVENFF